MSNENLEPAAYTRELLDEVFANSDIINLRSKEIKKFVAIFVGCQSMTDAVQARYPRSSELGAIPLADHATLAYETTRDGWLVLKLRLEYGMDYVLGREEVPSEWVNRVWKALPRALRVLASIFTSEVNQILRIYRTEPQQNVAGLRKIGIACPNCGSSNTTLIAGAPGSDSLRCSGCGHTDNWKD
jgi:hypothetical protein